MTTQGTHPLRELADAPVFTVLQQMAATPRGLTEAEAADRLHRYGDNLPATSSEDGFLARLTAALRSPFIALLSVLALAFVAVGDPRGSTTVAVMVVLAVGLRLWQQTRSVRATRRLRTLATATTTVLRRADEPAEPLEREVPVSDLVPGDVVVLRAGDVVAADLRVLSCGDLLIDQSVLSEVLACSQERLGRRRCRGKHRDRRLGQPVFCGFGRGGGQRHHGGGGHRRPDLRRFAGP